ncbi:MAG: bifunctional phosphopantothenoylcysteine decarboxylase/phosphopantothenate--cysteine ligase CoaBC [Acidiferrobacterales bacterium]|nr:bifunctional phosphopantothenoylcysteine decarboxylase/phosphopantothenate--cysteine ligase CoaBC [Acidiferrobacterales bacterium]
MASLTNKRILLGITGGIAAYKSADLARRLRDAGAEVRVVMTQAATGFITPLTMQAVSGHPVQQTLLDETTENGMDHIELARWADLVLVAPASANFLAKLNQGRADDLLSTVCLATDAPLAVAPAMNQQMWLNPATQRNVFGLKQLGIKLFGPGSGDQACGETGPGRMLEPEELVDLVAGQFVTGTLQGITVMVTAGPTWEAMDPVRGFTNRSSGKMGYAVAQAAVEAGARVILVSGPTALKAPERVEPVNVTSAREMHDAVMERVAAVDIFIGVAAVADYRPKAVAEQKIKKGPDTLMIELERNPDILANVAAITDGPFTVGFAAETENLLEHARDKLQKKHVDMIAANRVDQTELGFDADQNALTLISTSGQIELEPQPKTRLARELIKHIATGFHAKNTTEDSRQTYR